MKQLMNTHNNISLFCSIVDKIVQGFMKRPTKDFMTKALILLLDFCSCCSQCLCCHVMLGNNWFYFFLLQLRKRDCLQTLQPSQNTKSVCKIWLKDIEK